MTVAIASMKSRKALALAAWTLSALPAADTRAQVVFSSANGHHYERVLQDGITWPEANALATARTHLGVPGHLATITDQAEREFVNTNFGDVVSIWLGGFWDRDNAAIWRWVTGEPWSFTAFHPGEPNNLNGSFAYLMLNPTGLAWYDAWEGDTAKGFLIEYSPDVPGPNAEVDFRSVSFEGSGLSVSGEGGFDSASMNYVLVRRKVTGGGSTSGGFGVASLSFAGELIEYGDGTMKIEFDFASDTASPDSTEGALQIAFDILNPQMRFIRQEVSGEQTQAQTYSSEGYLLPDAPTASPGLLHVSLRFPCVAEGVGSWTMWLSPYAAYVPVQAFNAGNVAGGNASFVASLSAAPIVYDFENYTHLAPIDRISPAIDLRIVGPEGEIISESGKAFRSSLYNTPGRFNGTALLAESPSGETGRAFLEFDPPVEGVGAWMFDENSTTANYASLVVTDAVGQKHRTGTIDARTGTAKGTDGFVAVSSKLGIVAAEFESFVAPGGAWADDHTIDYLHVGKALPAISPNRVHPCPGSPIVLTAKAPGATSYQWRRNGIAISGATHATYQLNPATGRDSGVYDCRLTGVPGVLNTDLTTPAFVSICAADLLCDGSVNDDDFVQFVVAYNTLDCADPSMPSGCPADLNGDGFVDDSDFQIFVAAYDLVLCP